MNEWISKHRQLSDNFNIRREAVIALCVAAAGIIVGIVAKATDATTLVGEIGTDLCIWVFIAVLIASYSHHPIGAGINVMVFFLAVLLGYYGYCQFVLDFFPASYCLGWLIVALISLPGGFVVWFSKSNGFLGACITALSAGLIFAWSYPAFYTHDIVLILDVLYGIFLCCLLPRGLKMKGASLLLSAAVAFAIKIFGLLTLLPF